YTAALSCGSMHELGLAPLGNSRSEFLGTEGSNCVAAPPTGPILKHYNYRFGQFTRIPGIDQPTKATVKQGLARTVDTTAYDWNTACRGFDQDDSEPLAGARHYVSVCQIVVSNLFCFGDTPSEE